MTELGARALSEIRTVVDGRPARWANQPPGDYDGRERTLEIFNADAAEQRELMRKLRPLRGDLEQAAGGPVVIVFHTRKESARLYSEFVEEALRSDAAQDVAMAQTAALDDSAALATDVGVQPGARTLPRRSA